jgi:glutaredoxin 3
MTVTIYSTPTCGYCKLAKEYFTQNNVAYTEIDVAEDPSKAEEMVAKTGQMGVPVIIVDNDGKEDVIVGFDQDKLAPLLGL